MARTLGTIEQILAFLPETPQRIAALVDGLTPGQLRTPPGQDEWSATDVLAHLRSCADVWGGCIATILAEDGPQIRAVNPVTWVKQTNYRDLEFEPSLRVFATQRAELLAILEPLPQEDWSRVATVIGAGATLERTVMFYARWLAQHERSHFKQFAHITNTMHA